jgi:hypothetical protein
MRNRVFKDLDKLAEMLVSRMEGKHYIDLADVYTVDRSSIYHWCDKFGIEPIFVRRRGPQMSRPIIINFAPPKKVSKYQYLLDEEEQLNEGKNYIQYRIESRRRILIKNGTLQ